MSDAHPLRVAYAREYPAELAAYVAARDADAVAEALEGLPPDSTAAVVARLPHGRAIRILAAQDDEQLTALLDAASLDHALVLLLQLDEARRARMLDGLSDRGKRRTLGRLMVYPRHTVGALVDPAAHRLDADMPLGRALEQLRAEESEPDRSVWLVDADGGYRGLLDQSRALVARSDTLKLDGFLIPVRALRGETSLRSAHDFDEWLTHPELPVTDDRGHLLGTVTRRRLLAALADGGSGDDGLAGAVGELGRQYFRVLGICLGELLDPRGRER